MEEIFETLETADIDMYPSHSMIEPIVKNNFENTFQHQNGPNQHQRTHKNTSQHHQHRNTSQKYQNRNTGLQYQHKYFQRPGTSSIPHLKEYFIECGLNNKGERKFLIKHDRKLYHCPLIVSLYINKKAPR